VEKWPNRRVEAEESNAKVKMV